MHNLFKLPHRKNHNLSASSEVTCAILYHQHKTVTFTSILAGSTWAFMCIIQHCVIFVCYSTTIAKVLVVTRLYSTTCTLRGKLNTRSPVTPPANAIIINILNQGSLSIVNSLFSNPRYPTHCMHQEKKNHNTFNFQPTIICWMSGSFCLIVLSLLTYFFCVLLTSFWRLQYFLYFSTQTRRIHSFQLKVGTSLN